MMLTWFFLLVILVAAVWYFGNGNGNSFLPPNKKKAALDILKVRFAKGEIDEAEYEERRVVLEEHDI